ncbi:xanthine dehydrogenase/oxidase-like [Glandiceps talaboti]
MATMTSSLGDDDSNGDELIFFVNGKKVKEQDIDPVTTLLSYLRIKLHLTGSKLGCGEGGCGACTVMLSRYDLQQKKIVHMAINSCFTPVCAVHGMAVTTVEGIGSSRTRLHPVQERLAKTHGMQCGFCTPGMVMSMYALLRSNPEPFTKDIESAIKDNLCRCTGYRPILEGFKTFAQDGCCGNPALCGKTVADDKDIKSGFYKPSDFAPYDPSQEPIFPPELQLDDDQYSSKTVRFIGKSASWIRPVTLAELLKYKAEIPNAKLVVGNAEIIFEMRRQNSGQRMTLVSASYVPELKNIEITEEAVIFGASVSMSRMYQVLKKRMEEIPAYRGRIFESIVEMLEEVGGIQIKNVAGIGSHIMTASPLSDLIPLLMAGGVTVTAMSHQGGSRVLKLDNNFFTGYRTTCLRPDEVLVSLSIPATTENEYFGGYKVRNIVHRRDKDIAIVNAGMRVVFWDRTNSIKELRLSFGGTGPTVILATEISDKMTDRKWDNTFLEDVLSMLNTRLSLSPDGGMVEYRKSLLPSFFFKFYLKVLTQQKSYVNTGNNNVYPPTEYLSATSLIGRRPMEGTQFYPDVPDTQAATDPIGRAVMNESGYQLVTGEAVYCDDIALEHDELHFAFVTSTKAHAEIINIDAKAALEMKGVHAFVGAQDIPGLNNWSVADGGLVDEEIFASNEVLHVGQPIGGIVAENVVLARQAAKMVKVEYKEMEPILTIQEAINNGSYIQPFMHLDNGNVEQELKQSDYVIEGEVHIGGQSHFYMETQTCIAKPQEKDELTIIASTQDLMGAQQLVADTLGVPAHKVTCKVRRVGGGFGGKVFRTRAIVAACAVAANKVWKPVRLVLSRDEDMHIVGTRHPAIAKYKAGFTKTGNLQVLEADIFANAGSTTDCSHTVAGHIMGQLHNAYKIPVYKASIKLCKTNIPSSTSFRGFGTPQGQMIIETIIDHVAQKCNLSPDYVRQINLYKENDVDNVWQELPDIVNLRRCWDECITKSDYEKRKREVENFNSKNRWKKRGISVVPQKGQIGLPYGFLNQGSALVHIYKDGSVLLTHGGIEIGQGLFTKTIQIASRVLRIPPHLIHINETSTDKVPNGTRTTASSSTELHGNAVKVACEILMKRLEPFIDEKPKGSWKDWTSAAYYNRVSLSAAGFFKYPRRISGNINSNSKGDANNFHFSYGAACCEVEIDCLTGDHKLIRTDIVMDAGESLNPALDIGQIEGAFIQGYGLYVHEELRYSKEGRLLTLGPGMYNLPRAKDIPSQFNVSLLKKAPCKVGLYSSKSLGEPPLLLGVGVLMAIKNAIMSARLDAGVSGYFRLDSPATAERIRLACSDQLTAKVKNTLESEDDFFVRP